MWNDYDRVSLSVEHCSNCGAPLHPFADDYGCEVLHGSYGGGICDTRYDNACMEPQKKDKYVLCPKCDQALSAVETFSPPALGELFCLPNTDKVGKVLSITVVEEDRSIVAFPQESREGKYPKTCIILELKFPNKNKDCNGHWSLHLVEPVE